MNGLASERPEPNGFDGLLDPMICLDEAGDVVDWVVENYGG